MDLVTGIALPSHAPLCHRKFGLAWRARDERRRHSKIIESEGYYWPGQLFYILFDLSMQDKFGYLHAVTADFNRNKVVFWTTNMAFI